MCGREIHGAPIPIKIEGATLYVCPSCAKHGERIKEKKTSPAVRPTKSTTTRKVKVTTPKVSMKRSFAVVDAAAVNLVEDYADRIRLARQKMGLSQKEVSIKTKISVSELQSLETGKMRPSDETRERLEKFFNIKLTEEISTYSAEKLKKKPTVQTLGDIVVIKEKKKKE